MSRPKPRQGRRGGAATVERVTPGSRQPQIKSGGVNFKPVSDATVNAMYQHLGPQSNQGYMYTPGAPIKPVPGITPPGGPRQFEYPVGYNIAQLPRGTETYSFADLRNLAAMYYGIQLCQQVWFDYIAKLELVIEPRPDLLKENKDISEYADDIAFYQNFFSYPDREHDLHSWLQMAVRDQLEIDAVAIYVRKNRAGRPYALELIDGATVKPLINDRGRKPDPGFPAYEQYVYGVPACFLQDEDLIYLKETERTESVYGMSRVEKIILNVNVALRKQTKDMARFTDGTVPSGFLIPAEDVNWSQEEIEAYEIQFNNLLAGSDEQRARVKVLPRGFAWQATDDPDIHVDLDTFLLNITAATHGLTMAELAFTADVNRSTGEMQENVVYRRAMGPLMTRYARLFTTIMRKYFKEDRFVVKLAGFGEIEDFRSKASAYATLTHAGIISPSRAAHELNMPVDIDLPSPIIQTKNGAMLLEDLIAPDVRTAQKQTIIQGSVPKAPAVQPGAKTKEAEKPPKRETPAQLADEKSPFKKPHAAQRATFETIKRLLAEVERWQEEEEEEEELTTRVVAFAPSLPLSSLSAPNEKEARAEYRRWRQRALDDVKAGHLQRGFTTVLIPEHIHRAISRALAHCTTADEVREVFEQAREEGAPVVFYSQQNTCHCATCTQMHGQPLDERTPPYHDGCDCTSVAR